VGDAVYRRWRVLALFSTTLSCGVVAAGHFYALAGRSFGLSAPRSFVDLVAVGGLLESIMKMLRYFLSRIDAMDRSAVAAKADRIQVSEDVSAAETCRAAI